LLTIKAGLRAGQSAGSHRIFHRLPRIIASLDFQIKATSDDYHDDIQDIPRESGWHRRTCCTFGCGPPVV